MKKNMGNTDRLIRVIMAFLIGALYFFDIIDGTLAYILIALASIFLIVSFIGFCPLYFPFGINTCKSK